MQPSAHPFTRDLVLIGGGHTHALVLRAWGMNPLPGTRVTVINPHPTAPYSGMLPGHVAGHYDKDILDIDLVRLTHFAQARLVIGKAQAVDLASRQIHIPDHPPIGFDVASIDIGITTALPDMPGFDQYAIPAKPLDRFAEAWQTYLSKEGPADVAIIGGGVAGVELALAMSHALTQKGRDYRVHVIERDRALTALKPRAAEHLRGVLKAFGVHVHEATDVRAVTAEGVTLSDGVIPADFVCGAAGAMPHAWLSHTGLVHDRGFLTVDDRLRTSDPMIFAVGDCADMAFAPRPKAGVYAVRQAPVLLHNLRTALRGTGSTKPYHPQRDYLKLISLGGKSALGERFGMTFSGPWVWRWKDHIDQKFMSKLKELPLSPPPALPDPRAAGAEELGAKVMCGGCGAKLGQGALNAALNMGALPGDDAAVVRIGNAQMVISTDHLREMTADPVTMTRITMQHALGDIWAMGARPRAAVANIILPRMAPALASRTLSEIMATARAEIEAVGGEIVGGHSSLGAELTIGFTVTGKSVQDPILLSGARPGDHLILTKPIGSGVIMAAYMAGQARGHDVHSALQAMTKSQESAAQILTHAHAMTDVTGFGLLGHLRNICLASGMDAELDLAKVPLLPGALHLAGLGIRSSLYPDNRVAFPALEDTPLNDLLIDPQTSGGLLAAVPGDPEGVIMALQAAGHEAAMIGRILSGDGQIRIR